MAYRLPPLNAFRTFEAVARLRSFSKAAEELLLSQGAISYQIKNLEEKLDIVLLHRDARSVRLTEEGARLLPIVRSAIRRLEEEIAAIHAERKGGILTIAISTYVATRWLSPRINDFLRRAPGTVMQLRHGIEDPVPGPGGVDLAIRWGQGHWPGFAAEPLIMSPMRPYCSPEFASRLREPSDLLATILLREEPPFDLWETWLARAGLGAETPKHALTISDSNVRVRAAVDSQGVVLADVLVAEELSRGSLVAPFDLALEGWGYFLLYEPELVDKPAVAAFLEWARPLAR